MVLLFIIQSMNLKQPQLEPKPIGGDGIALLNVRPDRTEPSTTVMIPENGFKTYQAGSSIINVNVPGHGLTNGTTYLFRGSPTTLQETTVLLLFQILME